uniref:Uncharacterized protein n=1 Tax=Chrysemys picta bellii TaxID=8478 RepID=A0A8C3FCW4_CHRPI
MLSLCEKYKIYSFFCRLGDSSCHSFGYADWLDIILMIIGLIAAVANGTGLPLLFIVFGEMTNRFVMIGQRFRMECCCGI